MSVRAMKAGAVEFLTKPFRSRSLLDAVRAAIERDQSAQKSDLKPENCASVTNNSRRASAK
jgi:FixJ family two-component response regulator